MIFKTKYMKKFYLFIFLFFASLSAFAESPELPIYQAFDGRFNNSEGVRITEISQPSNYYYSIKVEDNQSVIDQLMEWIKETEKFSNSTSKSINSGKYSMVFYIPEGGINIGVRYPADQKTINIFLQSNDPFMPNQ